MLTMQLYEKTVRDIMYNLESDSRFREKCKLKFTQIVYAIRDEFKFAMGFYQISLWASKVLNSDKISSVTSDVALSVALLNSKEIFEEAISKADFLENMNENVATIISSDKLFTKLIINEFVKTESYLPEYLFKHNLLKNFLYGNCSVN